MLYIYIYIYLYLNIYIYILVFSAGNIIGMVGGDYYWYFWREILLVFSAGNINGMVGGNYYWYFGGKYYWWGRRGILLVWSVAINTGIFGGNYDWYFRPAEVLLVFSAVIIIGICGSPFVVQQLLPKSIKNGTRIYNKTKHHNR